MSSDLLMFIETCVAIAREYLLLIYEGKHMKTIFANTRLPAIISFLLVLPFMMMEFVNRQNFHEGFPIPLFFILWLLPILFIVTLMPIVRNLRQTGNGIIAQPINLLIRVAILIFIAWLWTGILADQLPCFLGVPNCD